MQNEAAEDINKAIEREREALYRLIELGASLEEIQSQSEALDKQIVNYYRPCV